LISIIASIVAFGATFAAGRRSAVNGLIVLLLCGYFYGIYRANVLEWATYFFFDSALLGFYLSQPWRCAGPADRQRTKALRLWLAVLLAWPALLCILPFQPLLVSLVGLRGNIFFLPLLLVGASLPERGLPKLAFAVAALDVIVLAFAAAEYFLGIERFYPVNAVTTIIYLSRDVANFTAYRIPATFTSAHAFAGTMVSTLPFLVGAWGSPAVRGFKKIVLLFGIVAALLGVLMASARVHFVICVVLMLCSLALIRMTVVKRVLLVTVLFGLGALTLQTERFQRFRTLSETEYVNDRIAGSVNRTFFEILAEYPMGNGLGGGGTSLPSFLQLNVRRPVSMENEFARILAEQGIIGLGIWLLFIFWCFSRSAPFAKGPWRSGRMLAALACFLYLLSGMIGIGLLTSIPQTVLFFVSLGWAVSGQATPVAGLARPVPVRPRVLAHASLQS
jgi:hypothetical protein